MKNRIVTTGSILHRIDYGEADRIITVLTPDNGKLSMLARGVRRQKSKLAGGIELFSVSDITYLPGKGEVGTLISTRLIKHYGQIVTDIDRVQLGYGLIKLLNKATEDSCEPEYFALLQHAYEALNDTGLSSDLIRNWFHAQLLRQAGHTPNLRADFQGRALESDRTYNFDVEHMAFAAHEQGRFTPTHIKSLRLLFDGHTPESLSNVNGLETPLSDVSPLIKTMLAEYITK